MILFSNGKSELLRDRQGEIGGKRCSAIQSHPIGQEKVRWRRCVNACHAEGSEGSELGSEVIVQYHTIYMCLQGRDINEINTYIEVVMIHCLF